MKAWLNFQDSNPYVKKRRRLKSVKQTLKCPKLKKHPHMTSLKIKGQTTMCFLLVIAGIRAPFFQKRKKQNILKSSAKSVFCRVLRVATPA